mgnify:CR=1 FL=1
MSKQQITPEAKRVAVIGSGSWGTTFAKILADGGNYVTIGGVAFDLHPTAPAEIAAFLDQLERETRRQVLGDGGHASRNPSDHLAVLGDLIRVRIALHTAATALALAQV